MSLQSFLGCKVCVSRNLVELQKFSLSGIIAKKKELFQFSSIHLNPHNHFNLPNIDIAFEVSI